MTPDLRKNVEDEAGVSYFAQDTETGENVLGPYGSVDYAETCRDRYQDQWPNELCVVGVHPSDARRDAKRSGGTNGEVGEGPGERA